MLSNDEVYQNFMILVHSFLILGLAIAVIRLNR